MEKRKETILITGGAGFIGTNTCLEALSQGFKVIAFDNLIRPGVESNILEHEDYTFINGDTRKLKDLKEVFKEHQIDAVIHLSANPGIPWSIKDPLYDFKQNAEATVNILEMSRLNGKIPVVYASTNKVYPDSLNQIEMTELRTRWTFGKKRWLMDEEKLDKSQRPTVKLKMNSKYIHGINEHYPVDSQGEFPHSPYGVSKLTGDLYCQEYWHAFGVPTSINRQSCIYGEYQHGVEDQGWVAWFMIAKILGKKLTIYGDGKQVRDSLFGRDLAKLYLIELNMLWDKEKRDEIAGKVYNVGGGERNLISLLEAIELLDHIGGDKYPKLEYSFKDWRYADQKVYYSDIKKISKYWKPTTSVIEGFNKSFEWFEKNIGLIKNVGKK